MGIKQYLQQKQQQNLQMTPQLRHAIKLLELPNLELTGYLQNLCLENPLIQIEDPDHLSVEAEQATDPFDADTYEYYWEVNPVPERQPIFKEVARTLHQHLHAQIDMAFAPGPDRLIALYLLDHVDANGYLTLDSAKLAEKLKCSVVYIEEIIKRLQALEPTGVFARNLHECLKLQWIERGFSGGELDVFFRHSQDFLKGDLNRLKKDLHLSEEDLKAFFSHLKELNPKPGQLFEPFETLLASPDLIIGVTENQEIKLRLNDRTHPKLIYDASMRITGTEAIAPYLKAKHAEAQWLTKALCQRRENLLKVGEAIIVCQQDFFLKGISALKPLTLKAIAELTGLHESTISRLTSYKYALTPFGTLELKSFFSGGLASLHAHQEDVAAARVHQHMADLIAHESSTGPYSDDQLVYELAKKGINISRRTVTKYREKLGISSSYERKRSLKRQQWA